MMRNKFLSLILLMIIFFFPVSMLSAYTWFIQGEWTYIYTAEKNSAREFSNASNSQTIKRSSGNRLVMINKATIKRQPVRVKFPVQQDKGNEEYIKSSYTSPDDLKFMKDFSSQIIGDAKYLDEAVVRIALWVRNNISYQLNSPSDAIGVIKSKRAYCVGYGDVAVELLRAAGIPSRTLSCYIPPMCGWGFGNNGGNHAFIEYYIPGRGWVCTDPQSTLNFVDPFHLVDSGFLSEIKRIDESYVTDYQDDPESWSMYAAEAGGEQKHPAFIFRVRDTAGKFITSPEVYFKTIPGKGWWGTTYYNNDGMQAEFSGSGKVRVVTSSKARYFSIIFTDPVMNDKKYTETVYFQLDSSVYTGKVNYAGAQQYYIKADFYQRENRKSIWLRNEKDEIMSGVPVSVKLGENTFEVTTDSRGLIYIITDEKEAAFTVSGKTANVTFDGRKNIRLFPCGNKADQDDYLKRNKLDVPGKPFLLLELYDLTGTFSGNFFSNVTVLKKGGKSEKLSLSKEGFAYYTGITPGEECTVICSFGNYYIKKKFVAPQSGVINLKIKPSEENFSSLEADESEAAVSAYYEIIPGIGTFEYKTGGSRIYLSFPDGKYLFADNCDAKNIVLLNVSKKPESFTYRPELNSVADYTAIAAMQHSGVRFIAGSVKSGTEKISDDSILFYNSKTGKFAKGYIDRNGCFNFAVPDPGDKDFLIYSGENQLIFKKVSASDEKFISIDTALLTRKEFRTSEKNDSSYYSYYKEIGMPLTLLIPQTKNGKLEPLRIDLKNNSGLYTMYLDKGDYYIAVKRNYDDVYSVNSEDKKNEFNYPARDGDKRDAFADRFAFLSASADQVSSYSLIEMRDADDKVLSFANILLNDSSSSKEFETDKNGLVAIPGLTSGAKYRIIYSAKGVYSEFPFTCGNERANPVKISLNLMKSFDVTLKNYDGYLYGSVPCRDKQGLLFFSNRSIVPEKDTTLKIYSDGSGIYLRFGRESVLKGFTPAKKSYSVDYKELNNSADEEYRKIVKNLFTGESVLIVSFTAGDKILNSSSFRMSSGTDKTFGTGRDGVVIIYPAPAGEIKLSYSDKGYSAEKTLTVKEKEASYFYYNREKDGNLLVNLGGKPEAIKNRSVNVYSEAKIENGKLLSFKTKMVFKTDENGRCIALLDHGEYYIEAVTGDYKKVSAGKSVKKIKADVE